MSINRTRPGAFTMKVSDFFRAESALVRTLPDRRPARTFLLRLLAVSLVFGSTTASNSATAQPSHARVDYLKRERGTSAETEKQFEAAIRQLAEARLPSERIRSAQLLGQLGNRKATEPLTAALHDSDLEVRQAAALALGQLQDRRAVDSLIEVLRASSDPGVLAAAAFSLGLIGDPRAVDAVIQTLKNPNAGVRISGAIALGRLGDPRAVEQILSLPHDKEHKECAPIAIALGQLKSELSSPCSMG